MARGAHSQGGDVYERVQHITLKWIANNPDIKEGLSREQIDEAIKRHADFELLYDPPYEDKKTVRVTGPFTVESLSPHRSLAFTGSADDANRETISEQIGAADAEVPSFEQSILDNLTRARIQNGRRKERIAFSSLDSYAGSYVQAVVERKADTRTAPPPGWRRDRSAAGRGEPVVHQGGRPRGDPGRRHRPAVRARVCFDPQAHRRH